MRFPKALAVVLVSIAVIAVGWTVMRQRASHDARLGVTSYEVFWAGEDPAPVQRVPGCATPVLVTLAANTGMTYDVFQGLSCAGEFAVGARGTFGSYPQAVLTGRSGRQWVLPVVATGEDTDGGRAGVMAELKAGKREWMFPGR